MKRSMVGQYLIVQALLRYLRTPHDFETLRSMLNVLLSERNYQPVAVRTLFAWIKELRDEGLLESQIHPSGKTVYVAKQVGLTERRQEGAAALSTVLRQSRSAQAPLAQALWDELHQELPYLGIDPEIEFGAKAQTASKTGNLAQVH